MEKLIAKVNHAQKAEKALYNAIRLYSERYETSDEFEQATYLASVIKHKVYLYKKHGIETIGSMKQIFDKIKERLT